MRFHEIIESYTDDTDGKGVAITTTEFNLSVDEFVDEQADLVRSFPIEDANMAEIIREYTEASSINAALAKGKKLTKAQTKQYDSLMALKKLKFVLAEEHHVYSGTSLFDPLSIIKRKVFKSPAFISASLNVEVAAKTNNFRREEAKADDDHVLHFVLPKGYKGCFYIGPYSTWPAELEMLIYPEQRFRLKESKTVEIDGGTRHIHTMVPA